MIYVKNTIVYLDNNKKAKIIAGPNEDGYYMLTLHVEDIPVPDDVLGSIIYIHESKILRQAGKPG